MLRAGAECTGLDTLADGRTSRTLNIVDDCTRECVVIEVGRSIPGERVIRVLDRVARDRGLPALLVMDNGPEFTSRALDHWAYWNQVALDFSRPGKPVDNAYIESFNGSLRDECLNTNWFLSIEDAQDKLESWRVDYNQYRPPSSLDNMTPEEFAGQLPLRANVPDY